MPIIENLVLNDEESFPYSLADIICKNEKTLSLMCGLVPDGTFILKGAPELLVLTTPLNTEHTYRVSADLTFELISQEAFPLSLADLKTNTKKK